MPRQNTIQTSWTKGEVSPLARGRVDVNLYASGAKTLENFIVRPQGPIWRRSGTKFVRSGRFPSQMVRLVPFEVSDDQAYQLEFGAGYIHFYKNKEPLFETTNFEIEFFTIANNGGLIQIVAEDHNSLPVDTLPRWVTSSVANNGGLFRLTLTTPTTMRTGQLVYAESGAYPTMDGAYTVTRISPYVIDLQGSTYNAAATSVNVYSHGLMAGDKMFISGATNFSNINDQFVTVKSVENYYKFTLANKAYSGSAISAIANAGGLFRVTSSGHGLSNGSNITISGVTNYPTMNASWNVINVTATTFDLDGSTFAGAGAADGTWVPYPTAEEGHSIPIEVVTDFTENDLADIRFTQSADVLYILHPEYPPQKLIRLDTDGDRGDWLLADVDFVDGPYLPLNDAAPLVNSTTPADGSVYRDVDIEVTGYTHTATVTAAVAFAAAAADQNRFLEYREGDQWRLAQLTSASSSSTTGTVNIIENIMLYLDETTKLKRKESSSSGYIPGSANSSAATPRYRGNLAEGNFLPNRQYQKIDNNNEISHANAAAANVVATGTITAQYANTFGVGDVGKYLRVHDSARNGTAYWGQITALSGTDGSKATLAQSVAQVSNWTTGNFRITSEVRTATITAKRTGAVFALFTLVTDVGRKIRLGFGGRWVYGTITAVASTSVATVVFDTDFPRDPHNASKLAGNQLSGSVDSGVTRDWRLGAWSATTGYPQVAVFQEQRLWFGATSTQPQTIWGSVSGDFENMSPTELDSTVLDDNAVTRTLASAKANAIRWMLGGPAMTVGTNGGEWQVRASSSIADPITPSNARATEYTGHGALSGALPARVGSSILFVDRSGEKVQKLFYSYEKDALDSDDLSVISEHILREHGGAVGSAFQQKPHSLFWVVCADGTLSCMTFNEKQEVIAWHHHEISGANVESIAVIPSSDGAEDEVWLVCNRTINGTAKRYVELLESDYYPDGNSRLDMRFLDSHVVIDGWTSTTVNGLSHLEAESVYALVDGVVQGPFTVASGAITLSSAATSEIVVGKAYDSVMELLPPEGGSQFGTSQGATKRVVDVSGRFYKSISVTFGPTSAAASLLSKNLPAVSPSPWFTGTEQLNPLNGYDVENGLYVKQSSPYPLNILFLMTRLETNE